MSVWTGYSERDDEDVFGDDDGYGGGCFECGGRGWIVRCIDDLCHGQDECIHGDPPSPCMNCNPKGDKEDGYL